jgi:hypothetical protein
VDRRHHPFQHRVKELAPLLGVAVSQQFHRASQVGKEHRDLLALAFQVMAGVEDFFGEICGGIRQRSPLLVCGRGRSWHRGRTCFSGPDQAPAVVIDHVWVCVQEFVFEHLKVVLVQTELKLEGAIGHAASTPEHGNGLVQDLLEGHSQPFTALALAPMDGKIPMGIASHGKSTPSIPGARGGETNKFTGLR